MQALIAGSAWELISAPIPLLKNSGFEIDVAIITSHKHLLRNRSLIRETMLAANPKEMPYLISKLFENYKYDLVVIGDDETLKEILNSTLSEGQKLDILPVVKKEDFKHLYSKIGLSNTLKLKKILTPDYMAINDMEHLMQSSNEFGFPFLLKVDSSSGGAGVFECQSDEDILVVRDKLTFPLLMQRKILGDVIDLSGFYQNGELIFFNYSKFEKVVWNKLGPSVLREFTQLGAISEETFNQVERLGSVLGANGFVSTTCIKSKEDEKLYFFEADMRPNSWINYGQYIGSNDSKRVGDYFYKRKTLTYPQPFNSNLPMTLKIPLIGKLKFWELIVNRHNAWLYPDGEQSSLDYIFLIWSKKWDESLNLFKNRYGQNICSLKNRALYSFEVTAMYGIKPFLPKRILNPLKALYKKFRSLE